MHDAFDPSGRLAQGVLTTDVLVFRPDKIEPPRFNAAIGQQFADSTPNETFGTGYKYGHSASITPLQYHPPVDQLGKIGSFPYTAKRSEAMIVGLQTPPKTAEHPDS